MDVVCIHVETISQTDTHGISALFSDWTRCALRGFQDTTTETFSLSQGLMERKIYYTMTNVGVIVVRLLLRW